MQNRREQWGQRGCTMTRNNICRPSGCSFPFRLNLIQLWAAGERVVLLFLPAPTHSFLAPPLHWKL